MSKLSNIKVIEINKPSKEDVKNTLKKLSDFLGRNWIKRKPKDD